jgi:hypothetical protein
MYKNQVELKSVIKGLAEESKRYNKFLKRAQSPAQVIRIQAALLVLGSRARHAMIAYGILRGVPYAKIERKCRENNKPNPKMIQKHIFFVISAWEEKDWSIEKISEMIKGS